MRFYIREKIWPVDLFATIDLHRGGALIRTGVEVGRSVRPELELGIGSRYGGDMANIALVNINGSRPSLSGSSLR